MTQDPIPGRVFTVEQPASGDIFSDDWTVHILKDDIRPNPTFPEPSMGPGTQVVCVEDVQVACPRFRSRTRINA